MARRSRNRDRDLHQRLNDDLLETLVARPTPTPPLLERSSVRITRAAEDLRRWAPGPQVPRADTGRPARIVYKVSVPKVRQQPGRLGKAPRPVVRQAVSYRERPAFPAKTTSICAKRQTRREVLFAKQKTKKGSGSPKHRNEWSSVSCGT